MEKTISWEVNEGGMLSFLDHEKQAMALVDAAITNSRPVELIRWVTTDGEASEELLLSKGFGEDYTSPELLPEPKCIRHKQIDAAWFFPYKSSGHDVKSYYCEECASAYHYTVFKQPLQKLAK